MDEKEKSRLKLQRVSFARDILIETNLVEDVFNKIINDENYRYRIGSDELIVNEVGMAVLDKIKRSVFWRNFQEDVERTIDEKMKAGFEKFRETHEMKAALENFRERQRKLIKNYEYRLKKNIYTKSKSDLNKIEEDALNKIRKIFKDEV